MNMNNVGSATRISRKMAGILLFLGVILTMLTGYRWGVSALSWIAMVPFILYARWMKGATSFLTLGGIILVTILLWVAKIITPPIPFLMAPLFAIPIGISFSLQIGIAEWIRRKAGDIVGVLAYAALVTLSDWAWLSFSSLGAWAAMGSMQFDSLIVTQLASIFGVPGIGFLMAFFQASLAAFLAHSAFIVCSPDIENGKVKEPGHFLQIQGVMFGIASILLIATLVFGAIQLTTPDLVKTHIKAAAVTTELGLGESGIPDKASLAANTDRLFKRTIAAAADGARLVVWNEAATIVEPVMEASLLRRGKETAQRLGVDLVMAYAVVTSRAPLLLDNKFVFITSDGKIAQTYRKHHPVPGEPSIMGTEPLAVIERPYGRVAGAICYDYDFPALAAKEAALGAELAVVPASDWAGIDRLTLSWHVFVLWSKACPFFDQYVGQVRLPLMARGRIRAWKPDTEMRDSFLNVDLPVGRYHTFYSSWGDLPVVALAVILLVAALVSAIVDIRNQRNI